MRTFLANLFVALTFLEFVFSVAMFSPGCAKTTTPVLYRIDVTVMEDGSPDYLMLTEDELHKFTTGAHLWANLETHRIDPEYDYAMLCELGGLYPNSLK